jgi:DNA mismatch endonuclease, patch repair protein
MKAVRRRDTAPEREVRRELHRRGLRYRVDIAPVPEIRRRADIVFPRAKLAIFVDGCFWHGCARHRPLPRTNAEYWRMKIERNQARDIETDAALRKRGWRVLRVWEHDDPREVAEMVVGTLNDTGHGPMPRPTPPAPRPA